MRRVHTTMAPEDSAQGSGGGTMVAEDFVGQTLVNRYVVEHVISQDAMSATFAGTDSDSSQGVRIQILDSSHDPNGPEATALLEEIDALQALNNPNLVVPRDVRLHAGQNICIITDYPNAESLAQRLSSESPLAPRVAMRIMREILTGIESLHRHELLALDCSPESVLLIADGQGVERAAVRAFGLRHVLGLEHAKSRDPKGCYAAAEYVSPEAVSGRDFTAQTDQYLAGLILYEMLAGRPAFSGDSFRKTARRHAIERPLSPRIVQRKANIPKAVDKLVMRCLEKTPSRRHGDLQSIIDELELIASDDDNFRARTSLNFGASSLASDVQTSPASGNAQDATKTVDEPAAVDESPADGVSVETEQPQREETSDQQAPSADTTQPIDPPTDDEPAVDATDDKAADPAGEAIQGTRDTMDVSRFVAEMEGSGEGVTVTDEPTPDSEQSTVVMTDPKMRALTQPLVSSSTRTQTNDQVSSEQTPSPDKVNDETTDEGPGTTNEADRKDLPAVTSRPFKETGQWFVESVEELQAQQNDLDQYDEFSAASDRNLFPWVVAAIALIVFGLLIVWPEGEPGLREKMNQGSETAEVADNAAKSKATNNGATSGAADAERAKDKTRLERLAAQAERAAKAQNWMGTPTSFVETVADMRTSDEGRKIAQSLVRTYSGQLVKEGTAALEAKDLDLALDRAELVIKINPQSSVAQSLKTTVLAQKAAAEPAGAVDANSAVDKPTADKAAAEKAAADKAAADKAAADKAAAEKAAAEKAAAEKAAAEQAAAKKAAAEKAAAEKAAAAKAKQDAAAKVAAKKAAQEAAQKAAAKKRVASAKVQPKPKAKKVAAATPKAKAIPKQPAGPSLKELIKNGKTQLNAGRFAQAATMFQAALRKNSKSAAAHAGLGRVAFQRKQFSKMAKHYKQSTRFAPRNAEYHVQLGLARFKLKKYADAKVSLTKALKIKPNHGKAKKYLRVVEKRLK